MKINYIETPSGKKLLLGKKKFISYLGNIIINRVKILMAQPQNATQK